MIAKTQQPVTIISHSLGGVLARFLAASVPHQVRQVIALGSPIDGSMRIHPLFGQKRGREVSAQNTLLWPSETRGKQRSALTKSWGGVQEPELYPWEMEFTAY